MTRHIGHAMAQASVNLGEAAQNSMVTIAARVPIFAEMLVSPTAAALAEWNEACSEKVSAIVEGSLAALAEWNAVLIGAAFRPLTPMGFATAAIRVAEKASDPAHAAVRANAARFSRL
jgi:hypothetical protein